MTFFQAGVIVVLVSSVGRSAWAGEDLTDRQSLKGIAAVYVSVGALNPEIEKDGLNTQLIRNDVELRLRNAGIRVLTENEPGGFSGSPHLSVMVAAVCAPNDIYSYFVTVEFRQTVLLERRPSIRITDAATWRRYKAIGYAMRQDIRVVRDSIRDGVDWFANDLLAANPRPR